MQYLHPPIKRNEITPLIVFSFFIALSVVLSNHIQITGNTYSGLATQNYITPYDLSDIGVLVAVFTVALLCCLALYHITRKAITAKSARDNKPLAAKPIAACTAIMFALHLPYLLTYYPGFVFSDSLSSIGQALGQLPCSNHFPVAYTALIGACIALAHTLGLSTTTGCALYSLMQTFVMCATYSLMIQWIMQRTRIARWWCAILVAVFGLAPYIATYSIALWKDPLFSAAIVVVTVLLFDFVSTSGKITHNSKAWIPMFAICCIIIAFLRSNGLLIDAGVFAALLLCSAKRTTSLRRAPANAITAIPLAAIALNLLVTGPIYSAAGIAPAEKAEGYGIPLNQMARVVALDGDMSEADAAYMNELLPFNEYASVYAPTCIDSLKWNSQFNNAALDNDFLMHWISMGIDNPIVYFESWELQTFGYWTINHPLVLLHNGNINGGVPQMLNSQAEANAYGITIKNYLGDTAERILSRANLSIPLGWVAWGTTFLAITFFLQGRRRYIIVFVPCLMLVASLLIASPIWYWERYGAALQFLAPFFLALPLALPANPPANNI